MHVSPKDLRILKRLYKKYKANEASPAERAVLLSWNQRIDVAHYCGG